MRPTIVLYGNRVEQQIVHREELEALCRDHGTEVIHALSEPPAGWEDHTGMVDEGLIRATFDRPEAKTWLYLLCGPPIMMEVVEDTLIEMGVHSARILSERFRYD